MAKKTRPGNVFSINPPRHATPRHATPRHATPRHATQKGNDEPQICDDSRACVFFAALKAGAKDNGPPSICAIYHPNYSGAFVIDPDGHNIKIVCHRPAAWQFMQAGAAS
jgi:hypothetical protein